MLSNAEYPVLYQAQVSEQRNRATVFFRLLLAIPHMLYITLLSIALVVTVPVTWLVLVITARYPRGLYDFHAGWLALYARLAAYIALQTDKYPGWGLGDDASYPVRVHVARPQEVYSRWKVLLRYPLSIPFSLVAQAYGIVTFVIALLAWFMAVFTGKTSIEFHRLINWGLAANVRVTAYGVLMLTDEWPPFEPDSNVQPAGQLTEPGVPPIPS